MTIQNRALVMEGGGLRGNYTAGVLDSFLEADIEFPYIIGVSAGAGFGCSFVSKQKGRNLEILKRYRNDPRYLSLRSYLKTGNLFGLDFLYNDIPLNLIPFDFKAYHQSTAKFVVVCTDCISGLPVYYENDPELLTVLKGSSALPFVSRMVDFQGRLLLDGAITDPIPIKKAREAGYKQYTVILTHSAGYRKKEEPHPPARLLYRKYPKLVKALADRVASYNRSMELIEAEEKLGNCLVIRPSGDLKVSRTEKSVEKLLRLYENGLEDGKIAAAKLKETAGKQS
jgi:predicted patatin/cPLA2 family phospholipase